MLLLGPLEEEAALRLGAIVGEEREDEDEEESMRNGLVRLGWVDLKTRRETRT